jgi:hypothetical protein
VSGEQDRQLRQVMLVLAELAPGCVCMDTTCPMTQQSGVPHMATDSGPHPHPYGLIETSSHGWRRKHWWRR